MPGAGGATSSEPKRELEPQPPPSPKRAKIDQEETKPDPSPAEEAAEGETGTVVEEKERPIPVARTRRSQFWYYRDSTNLVQGPFYPGQMSEWFEGGHFAPSHNVAPSFQGEVPQQFFSIESLFDLTQAFWCDDDVAWKPPEEPPPPEREKSDEELRQQLRDELLNNKIRTGPVFVGKWVDN
eukprot:TRINITY_DN694_c0_g1_i3.p1 TRINITY_DN694_c0_g1~~TRINITY_DN694_c0_g1_i3.p1  ORF type:complete len:182 (-),score=37.69 TRINITY_DN694_c0_g1_i3:258-803(-)